MLRTYGQKAPHASASLTGHTVHNNVDVDEKERQRNAKSKIYVQFHGLRRFHDKVLKINTCHGEHPMCWRDCTHHIRAKKTKTTTRLFIGVFSCFEFNSSIVQSLSCYRRRRCRCCRRICTMFLALASAQFMEQLLQKRPTKRNDALRSEYNPHQAGHETLLLTHRNSRIANYEFCENRARATIK